MNPQRSLYKHSLYDLAEQNSNAVIHHDGCKNAKAFYEVYGKPTKIGSDGVCQQRPTMKKSLEKALDSLRTDDPEKLKRVEKLALTKPLRRDVAKTHIIFGVDSAAEFKKKFKTWAQVDEVIQEFTQGYPDLSVDDPDLASTTIAVGGDCADCSLNPGCDCSPKSHEYDDDERFYCAQSQLV